MGEESSAKVVPSHFPVLKITLTSEDVQWGSGSLLKPALQLELPIASADH